jgi:hypothetical protein
MPAAAQRGRKGVGSSSGSSKGSHGNHLLLVYLHLLFLQTALPPNLILQFILHLAPAIFRFGKLCRYRLHFMMKAECLVGVGRLRELSV